VTSRPADIDVRSELEAYRGELTGYCYRMLGWVLLWSAALVAIFAPLTMRLNNSAR
jgi:hypothetical protein